MLDKSFMVIMVAWLISILFISHLSDILRLHKQRSILVSLSLNDIVGVNHLYPFFFSDFFQLRIETVY